MPQIRCENLTLGYEGRAIVENLNLEISKGDYLCIVGENGSGKSTLIRTLLGLLPPMGGQIEHGDGLLPNEIGYLPQQTDVQKDFPASVAEIVLSGCQGRCGLRPFYNKQEKTMADAAIERLGITGLKSRCYRELSGGQQQRVLLARALCATQKILLLDEPVTGLDPKAADDMYELIHQLNVQDKVTIIMVTHDLGAALHYATHILHIGKEIYFGAKADYLRSPAGAVFAKEGGRYDLD